MFKDYDKYLLASLKVYIFVLISIFILKLVGFNYFGLDLNNPIILKIGMFLDKYKLDYILNIILLYFYTYIIISVSLNKRKMYIQTLIMIIIGIIVQSILQIYNIEELKTPIDIIIWLLFIKIEKGNPKRMLKIIIFNIFFQYISVLTRSNNNILYLNNTIIELILSMDYIILMIILYKINFMKGEYKICGLVVGSYLQMKKNFLNLLKKLQKNLQEFKKLNEEEKYTIFVYLVLSMIWNVFTIVVIFAIAKLNDTVIECIFILISFWITKRVFGRAFHFKSMIRCFIVSNLSYYVLNRITTPIGISILIPIMLGTGLSYVTSKLVKKVYKPLYRGMPIEEFDNSILKVTDKNSDKYNVCYDYFINKQNAVYLGRKYGYSDSGIRKIASRINDKIKALE